MEAKPPLPQPVRDRLTRQATQAGAALVLGAASYLVIWTLASRRPATLVTAGVALVAALAAVTLGITLGQYVAAKRRAAGTVR